MLNEDLALPVKHIGIYVKRVPKSNKEYGKYNLKYIMLREYISCLKDKQN